MATLILSAVGQYFGGQLGSTIGALVGRQIDSLIFKPGDREGARLAELKVTTSSYGVPMARHFGRMRVAGQIVWSTDLIEHREKHGNGKGNAATINYTYTASFAVALASRPIKSVGRIWADGKLLRGAAGDMKVGGTFRLHTGEGDQPADSLLAAAEGAGRCPAYRGLAYVVFEELQLTDFGNRIPTLSFEVIADEGALAFDLLLADVITDYDAAVPLPGLSGVSNEGALSELLGALDPLYPVDCDACDTVLTIRPDRLQDAPIALPEAATSTKREDFGGNAGFSRKRTIGERFVLLDSSGITLDPVAVGDTPTALIAAIGLADTVPVTSPIGLRGIGYRPLTPVHARLVRSADSALTLGSGLIDHNQ